LGSQKIIGENSFIQGISEDDDTGRAEFWLNPGDIDEQEKGTR